MGNSEIKIGVWDPTDELDTSRLTGRSGKFSVTSFEDLPDWYSIHTVDCLVAVHHRESGMHGELYDRVRQTHPVKPFIVIADGDDDDAFFRRIEADEYASRLRRSREESFYPVLSGRIQRMTNKVETSEEAQSEVVGPFLYETRTREFIALWLLVGLTYGVGDLVTTVYAVFHVPGLYEGNPFTDWILQTFGGVGFLVVKVLIFIAALQFSINGAKSNDLTTYYAPPIAIILVGTGLTAWNMAHILAV